MDLKGSVDKTIRLIKEAGGNGAKVIGFPELFIPGMSSTFHATEKSNMTYHVHVCRLPMDSLVQ